ncbi:MAG: DUF2240 family protein [Candidatus Diapherotrites archaeon]|nr:DUF2240 family protein [Candidatus Diapherotrites archaeon]
MVEVAGESVVERLLAKAGRPKKEVQKLVEEKKKKFAGLLTDEGAAFMIAKEFGVDLSGSEGNGKKTQKLAELSDGQSGLDLRARLIHVFSPKKFEKNGKSGVLCNAIVGDGSKEMRLTFWRDDVKKMGEQKIERGTLLDLTNVGVSSYNEQKQLSIGFGGTFFVTKEDDNSIPMPQQTLVKLKDLAANQNNIDVFAKVSRVFEERQFESNGKNGKVIGFEIADETKTVRASAWNELVEFVKKLSAGDTIKIEGAYTKEGLNGAELNLGWQSRIIENPKNFAPKSVATDFEEKKIQELTEFMNAKVSAKIERVENGKLHYLVCPACGKKLERDNDGYNCLNCRKTREPDINLVVGLTVNDGESSLRAVLFGKQAEKIISISKEEMKQLLQEKPPEEIIDELNQKLSGKEICVQGRVRKNATSEQNELIVQSVVSIS